MDQFIELFNKTIDAAKPINAAQSHAKSLDDTLKALNLDSLDFILMSVYLGEIYGVPEEVMEKMEVHTVAELKAFLEANRTVTRTHEEALEMIV